MSCADSASKLPTLCCRMLGAYSIGGCWGSATCSAGIFRGQEDSEDSTWLAVVHAVLEDVAAQICPALGLSRVRRRWTLTFS